MAISLDLIMIEPMATRFEYHDGCYPLTRTHGQQSQPRFFALLCCLMGMLIEYGNGELIETAVMVMNKYQQVARRLQWTNRSTAMMKH